MTSPKINDNLSISSQEELQTSEIRYRRLFEAARDGILILDAKTRKITDVNPFMLELLGYTREEFLGKELWEIGLLKDEDASIIAFRELQKNNYIRYDDLPLETKSGQLREVEFVSNVYMEGVRRVIQCNIRDITERKTLEKKTYNLTAIVESSNDAIISKNFDGTILTWNKAAELIFGFREDEVIGQNISILASPEQIAENEEIIEKIRRGELIQDYETTRLKKDGSSVPIILSISPIKTLTGETIAISKIAHDISDRKYSEKALEAAAQRERAMIENALDVIFTIDTEGKFVSVSPASLKVWGYQPEELVERRYIELVEPEDVPKTNEVALEIMSGVEARDFENRFLHKNGSMVDIRWTAFWSHTEQLMFCLAHDITERKLAERKIRESEDRYRIVAETANDVILTIDEHSSILFVNSSMEKTLGYKPEELIGKNLSIIVPERLRAAHTFGMNRYMQTGRKHISWSGIEVHALHRDGSEIQVEISFSEYHENNKRLFTAVLRDITERKNTQQLILESEEKYRSIVETANEGIWLTDIETRATYVNRQMATMLGYTVEEMLGRPIFDFIFDEDLPAAKHKYEQRKIGESETGEFRLRRKDGSGIITLYNTTPRRNQAGEIIGFLSMRSDITESKKAEIELRYAEAKYRSLVESSPAIVYLCEPHPPFSTIYVSPNIAKFGYTAAEWFIRDNFWMSLIHPEDRDRVLGITATAMRQGLDTNLEYRLIGGDGTIHWVQDRGCFVSDEDGNRTGWQGIMLDISETKVLEEQLRQSQKLESVGLLAGGIAHDFNNMLTAINGYSDLTLRKLKVDDPLRRNIEEIKKAGQQSADLTHQLLAFSRQQVLKPVVLDLNEIIGDTTKMLQRLIGEDIQLTTTLSPKVGLVKVDPGQFSQIIMNLAVNARDAMPQGGKLTIETANIFLEPDYTRRQVGVLPGAYVVLAVSDTGTGISQETKEHIFEPFFTTKEVGQGTGLGLATVYGIVKQSGGNIEVDSEQGEGTTFRIYLPRVVYETVKEKQKDIAAEMPRGTETILLVEDEEIVRHLTQQVLEECGYTVTTARNGLEALEISDKKNYQFDLLMTDVVMPQMGGRELAEKLTKRLPNLLVLFTSGYTDDAVVRHGVIETEINFIQKPFTPGNLTNKIREIIDNPIIH